MASLVRYFLRLCRTHKFKLGATAPPARCCKTGQTKIAFACRGLTRVRYK